MLLQHFRGNLDNWDPALIDALASTRRVVTFDNAGVGGSTGRCGVKAILPSACFKRRSTRLGRTQLRPDPARAHLVYGEWLGGRAAAADQ